MKFVYRICLFCIVATGFFYLGCKASAFFYPGRSANELSKITAQKISINDTVTDTDVESADAGSEDADIMGNTAITDDLKSVQASSGDKECLTCDTTYLVEKYDGDLQTSTLEIEELPEKYIGYNRDELITALEDYQAAPSLSDVEEGFVSVELVSFSETRVKVKKTYYSGFLKEQFYLVAQNNYIVVYYLDMENVYQYTDILVKDLPEDIAEEVMDKKYIGSEEELYNFLESYSS